MSVAAREATMLYDYLYVEITEVGVGGMEGCGFIPRSFEGRTQQSNPGQSVGMSMTE